MMRKLLPLLLLISVVALSGCPGVGGPTGAANGVIISAFSVDPEEAYVEEPVFFTMDVENVGGAVATDVVASLIGLPDEWQYGDEGDEYIGTLEAPEAGIEGGYESVEWELTAPKSQTDITYPFDAQVSFGYKTHSETLVRVASRDWIYSLPENQREAEKNKLGEVSHSPEQGPIHTTIKLRRGLPYTERGELKVSLILQNVGSGSPSVDDERNAVHIDTLSGMTCDDYGVGSNVPLTRAATRTLSCTIPEPATETWKNVRIDIDLSYDYSVRTSYQVKVLGSPSE